MSDAASVLVNTAFADTPDTAFLSTEVLSNDDPWRAAIKSLKNWLRSEPDWDEDGFEAPNKGTISFAIEVAYKLRALGYEGPTRVLPNADGGILFERIAKPSYATIDVSEDGCIEFSAFHSGKLLLQRSLRGEEFLAAR